MVVAVAYIICLPRIKRKRVVAQPASPSIGLVVDGPDKMQPGRSHEPVAPPGGIAGDG